MSAETSLLERCRATFAALNVVNATAALIAMIVSAGTGAILTLSLVAGFCVMWSQWRALRRHDVGVIDELMVGVGMLGASLALPDATMTVSLVFSAIMFRSLYGAHTTAAARAMVYLGIYALALQIAVVDGRLSTTFEAALLLPLAALVMSTVTMRMLYIAVLGRDAAAARQAILARTAARLLAAHDRDSVVETAWWALSALARDNSCPLFCLDRRSGRYRVVRSTNAMLVGQVTDTAEVDMARDAGDRGVHIGDGTAPSLAQLDRGARWLYALDGVEPEQCTVIASAQPLHREVLVGVQTVMRQATLALAGISTKAELEHQAGHDGLTGLPNRKQFMRRLTTSATGPAHGDIAVMFIDLDGFKAVNDFLGHAAGDELLLVIARRLTTALGTRSLVARLGGDEFAVLVGDVQAVPEVQEAARRLERLIAEPVTLSRGDVVEVGASIGVHVHRTPCDPDLLLHAADEAMYSVKATRRERRHLTAR